MKEEFNSFPTGKKRKETLTKNEKDTEGAVKFYEWADSPLDGYPLNKKSFLESFNKLLPNKEGSLRGFIEEKLKDRKGEAVGIEFGGPGIKLFEGFSPGFFKETYGVTLTDYRDYSKHKSKTHKVIEGNVMSYALYDKLEKTLEGKKADLIIERMAKGLEYVPNEPFAVSKILEKWYELLNEEGIMFIQTPVSFNNLLEEWGEMIEDKYRDYFDFYYVNEGKDDTSPGIYQSGFRLQRLKGAPEKLPFLDPRTVFKTPKG